MVDSCSKTVSVNSVLLVAPVAWLVVLVASVVGFVVPVVVAAFEVSTVFYVAPVVVCLVYHIFLPLVCVAGQLPPW